jgi:predicted permease
MLRDLKFAARVLLQSKVWTAVVLLSLALGIGANTALFSAVSGLLLQKLPVGDPDTLVRLSWFGDNDMMRNSSEYGFVRQVQGKNAQTTFSYPAYLELRKANTTLTDLLAQAPLGPLNVIVNDESDVASSMGVSGNFFNLLQMRPETGRLLTEDDDRPSAPLAAVISYAFWQKRFALDPEIAGRVVTMNNQPVTIVGVVAKEFPGLQRLGVPAPDVTVPIWLDTVLNASQVANPKDLRLKNPTSWFIQIVGRLKPGVTEPQVLGNLGPVFQATAAAGMESYMSALTDEQRKLSNNQREGKRVPELLVASAAHGIYEMDETTTRSASVLSAVVVVILLIVSANVANLLLSRATARRKEISVRLSMGATRGRLIRQLLTESLLLSLLGGALGVLVGYWSRQLLPFGQEAPIDWRVFLFAAGLSLVTGLLFGVAPALRATRADLAGTMKENSRSVSGTRSILSKSLIVVQVALSLVLIVGAGLFLRTLFNLRAVDVGFDTRNLMIFSVNPSLNRYTPERSLQVFREMQDELKGIAGVQSVALTRVALLSGGRSSSTRWVPGQSKSQNLHVMQVSPEFFETIGVPVVMGRGFTDRDTPTSPKVAVINETAARLLFPNDNAVGKRMGTSLETNSDYEVIGVVRDTKYADIRAAAPPTWYDSALQNLPRGAMQFVVRTAADPVPMTKAMREAIRRVDSTLPVVSMSTQAERVEGRFVQERLFANAYSLFGALALVLACVGLFGVMSYNVARRTNEIGIRMALGARAFDVIRMILAECWLLIGIGVAAGVVTAIWAGRYVRQVLFGLAPTDVTTLIGATLLIATVASLAGFLPARRAARVDPLVALHHE